MMCADNAEVLTPPFLYKERDLRTCHAHPHMGAPPLRKSQQSMHSFMRTGLAAAPTWRPRHPERGVQFVVGGLAADWLRQARMVLDGGPWAIRVHKGTGSLETRVGSALQTH